ncbi:MAG: hypothetical protein ACI9EP_001708, partial [Oceanospirillaceae bacterium]
MHAIADMSFDPAAVQVLNWQYLRSIQSMQAMHDNTRLLCNSTASTSPLLPLLMMTFLLMKQALDQL